MTALDYQIKLPGYYEDSICPFEYGGSRRQKHARSPGMAIGDDERLQSTIRIYPPGNWPMGTFIAGDRLYSIGCSVPFQPDHSEGWIEEIDPITLEPKKSSPKLQTGGHNWCGGGAVLANGNIVVGFGRYLQILSLDLELLGEMELPVDHAHNGIIAFSDGMLVTRNLETDSSKLSHFTLIDPERLEVLQVLPFAASSVGRFSADEQTDCTHLYATTSTDIHRLIYRDRELMMDPDWKSSYSLAGEDQGFAWCNCVGDDSVWFMDMGNNAVVRHITQAYPVGTKPLDLSQREPINSAPVRLFRVSTKDSSCSDYLTPFNLPNGGHAASPLYVPEKQLVLVFDTSNGKTGVWRHNGPGDYEALWVKDLRNSNQPLYYPDTGEVVLDDVQPDQTVEAVVVDLETGREKGRVKTGTMFPAAMGFSPGFHRDVYSASGFHGALYRVFVE
ncbi:MAG: hypothetical protein AAF098_00370 [Pseudomonadota bacterium]